ncbi:thiol-disulfide oxidoreductase ResA [Viridibacillus sp. FSL R5-0477]|uniref:Thiol-disulfide oxidoreductase resA n=1 Tax=Viridibacillus arenosi FSL R5-213 TaxID=1227360 RepID=W4F282_9BACL|nr:MULTISPECIES: thiol-disulfide oxidoreductase ResA [Viridibacillus]ETT86885.1 Thiol-disulfide oxidoreductase resA [Viridibacillus arenosi FSL R5-213]OMC83265.1 thiol-disulfide oxidoreductase [Viridibacillus sp. FSL H8-0123]OMC88176.1 thiol-disulfide oxidoreductase [Viridibacillus arenosi]
MKKRMIVRTLFLVIIFSAITYTVYSNFIKETYEMVKIGDVAPDFILEDLNGEKHKLSDYKGKGVVLNFWATYCDPCKEEMPDLEENYIKYKSKGVEILAINNAQTTFEVKKFTKNISFPILIDHSIVVFKSYNIDAIPTSIFIDSEGTVKKISVGGLTNKAIQEDIELIIPNI